MTVTDLAGPDIEYHSESGTILRQRCSWCGCTLIDVNLDRISVPVGQDPTYPRWQPGSFVRSDSPDGRGGVWSTADWKHPEPTPDDACLRMPLEVTG